MLLRKATGGCEIEYQDAIYKWDADGDITDVPAGLGAELLGIRGGGYAHVDTPTAREAKAVKAKADAQARADSAPDAPADPASASLAKEAGPDVPESPAAG